MAKRKTEFYLARGINSQRKGIEATAEIVESTDPYLHIRVTTDHYRSVSFGKEGFEFFVPNTEIETFALNILKALKSKHLKQ